MATTAEPWVPETAEEKARYAYAFQRGRETEARVLLAALLDLALPPTGPERDAKLSALTGWLAAAEAPPRPAALVEDE